MEHTTLVRRWGDGVDRCQWQREGDEGPPVRGMSRSDKGCAGSGEDGKTTSGQEGLQPVTVRDDCFSGVADWENRNPHVLACPLGYWLLSFKRK